MRILIALTYFQPHKSGLTVYAVRQAQALAARGHQVTVLTSQYDPQLPREEVDQGVQIIRVPVAFRLSKGVIMPQLPLLAWQLIGEADIVNLHVPQVDAALLAVLAQLRHKPVVLTYHCDLKMPKGMINQLAGWVARAANQISANLADRIVHNTQDFAEHSPFLKTYLGKLRVIQPPILVEPVLPADIESFREQYKIEPDQRIVGMAARLATEKGVEYLVEAMPLVLNRFPQARVIFVGDCAHVFGEEAYKRRLLPMIADLGEHWTFLGIVSEVEKTAFFENCDVLALPSINSTESFGMVQVEAMTCGTPVVATNLPGVRQPVLTTGLGKIVPPADSGALADAIINLLSSEPNEEPARISEIANHYSPETVAAAYERLYQEVLGESG